MCGCQNIKREEEKIYEKFPGVTEKFFYQPAGIFTMHTITK